MATERVPNWAIGPLPEGWVVDVKPLGFEVWAHSPDGEYGIAVVGPTKDAAIIELRQRIAQWNDFRVIHPSFNPK